MVRGLLPRFIMCVRESELHDTLGGRSCEYLSQELLAFLVFRLSKNSSVRGHKVTGLARSDASAKKLTDAGAQVLRGDIEDLDILRQGAAAADGVIHTAFYHEITHMRLGTRLRVLLGGSPSGIVTRFLAAAIQADKRALETLGQSLSSADRPLVATFATIGMTAGKVAIEDNAYDPKSAGNVRGSTEKHNADAGLARRTNVGHSPAACRAW